jgi:hypothetical protein
MKNLIFMCVLLLSGTSLGVQAKEVTFYLGQGHDDWAFEVIGKGRALVGKSLVYVKLDNLNVINNPKHNKSKYVEKISIGFGYLQPDGQWNVKNVHGGEWEVKDNIGPGDRLIFGGRDATLSLSNENAENYWIVVTVQTSNRATVYAHSRKDIFK